jgi:DNA-binding MarR family transcriptional regulator
VDRKEIKTLRIMFENDGEIYPKKLADRIGKSLSTGSRRLQKLEEKGLVEKKGEQSTQQWYEITKKGSKTFASHIDMQPSKPNVKLRAHKIVVKFPLIDGKQIIENNSFEGKLELKNNSQVLDRLNKSFCEETHYRITYKHLLVYLDEIYYPPTPDGVWMAGRKALDMAKKVKEEVKKKYPNLKFGRGEPDFSDIHIAFEGSLFASACEELNQMGLISDKGNWRLTVDRSNDVPEVEYEGTEGRQAAENYADNIELFSEKPLRPIIEWIENQMRKSENVGYGM